VSVTNTTAQLPADGAETAERVGGFVMLFDILICTWWNKETI